MQGPVASAESLQDGCCSYYLICILRLIVGVSEDFDCFARCFGICECRGTPRIAGCRGFGGYWRNSARENCSHKSQDVVGLIHCRHLSVVSVSVLAVSAALCLAILGPRCAAGRFFAGVC